MADFIGDLLIGVIATAAIMLSVWVIVDSAVHYRETIRRTEHRQRVMTRIASGHYVRPMDEAGLK